MIRIRNKKKKTRHYSVVHQKYYIHDAETNETRWATEEDLVDVAHDEEKREDNIILP